MNDQSQIERTAAQIGASHVIDKLMHKHAGVEIGLTFKDQEEITMGDITNLLKVGEEWKKAAYEEFDTPEIRKSWKPETHAKIAETRFDEWSEWSDALQGLEGKAPISKTIGLLEKQRLLAEKNANMIAEDAPLADIGLSSSKPEELQALNSLHKKRALVYEKAIRMVEADWELKKYSGNN